MSDGAFVVLMRVHLHFPESGSLKAKRAELNRVLIDAAARHGGVSVRFNQLCLGVDLPTVLKLATINAAAAIKRPDLGTLEVGSVGEATVIDQVRGSFDYADSIGEHMMGDQRLQSAGVVLAGKWWHPA